MRPLPSLGSWPYYSIFDLVGRTRARLFLSFVVCPACRGPCRPCPPILIFHSVIPGSIWAEKICSTNGLGLSVELKKPTIVSGKEHFFIAHEKISCFASPIINYDGKTIGIIDASTDSKSREQHTLALVKLATRSIETKLFINKFSSELILSFHPRSEYLSTTSVGLLAINGDGVVVEKGYGSTKLNMVEGLELQPNI